MKQPQRLGDDFALAFARAFRSRKCSESRPSENERPPFLIAGSGKPWHGHEKHCPAAWIEAAKKTSVWEEPSPGPLARTGRKWKCARLPSWSCPSCVCDSKSVLLPRRCPRRSRTRPPISHHGDVVLCHARRDAGRKRGRWATEAAAGPRCARGPCAGKRACPNLDSSSKTDLETRRKHREAFRARADSAQSAPGRNRARDHPLQRRTQDHWATSPTAGPRRARGSAAAKRARPRKRANLARCKICDFGPELGFEQPNRFRSLRDTRRTEKKVLRKPPAARPVVGQTFKYIYIYIY